MRKNHGFTLVEVLVAVALTGVILLTGYSAFQRIMQAQSRLGATIDVQKNLFYTNEKMAALIREGGTIDYEEYFNRRMLGYARGWPDFNGDTSPDTNTIFTFTNFSHFGNGNNPAGKTPLRYCGFQSDQTDADICISTTPTGYVNTNKDAEPFTGSAYPVGEQQPFGQYSTLSLNYDDPVGFPMPIKLPPIFKTIVPIDAIQMAARDPVNGDLSLTNMDIPNVGLPELYLIKKNLDSTYTRTYFRHVYVQDSFPGAPTCSDPTSSLDGCLGKIQMTKLESCDSIPTGGDGIIDAWIPSCEFNISNPSPNCSNLTSYKTTYCPTSADKIYYAAHEETIATATPSDPNLVWVDVTDPDMNVVRATFLPNPLKVPSLMSGSGEPAQSPTISVYLEVQLSTRLRNKSFVQSTMNYPRTLITTYDLSE